MSWPTLRDNIESCILTFSYHVDEKGAYKICANEVIKEIAKRIDQIKEDNISCHTCLTDLKKELLK